MIWRAATDHDLPQIDALLRANLQSSMFLLGNLRDYGLNGDAANAMTLWLLESGSPGVFAVTNAGMVLMQAPGAGAAQWRAAQNLIANQELIGCTGDAGQVRGFLNATGLNNRSTILNRDESAFALDLNDLILPDTNGTELMPLSSAPRELIERWRAAFHVEALGSAEADAVKKAAKDIGAYLARDSHRILMENGAPLAMTGFNAALPDIVQIGAVFTPPELRCRGYAQAAVALHLQQAQQTGVTKSILFTANPAASRAYAAIGFRPAGQYSLVLFDRSPKEMT